MIVAPVTSPTAMAMAARRLTSLIRTRSLLGQQAGPVEVLDEEEPGDLLDRPGDRDDLLRAIRAKPDHVGVEPVGGRDRVPRRLLGLAPRDGQPVTLGRRRCLLLSQAAPPVEHGSLGDEPEG